ncbi:polysaccharide pyruvyl transferase family protein [Methanoplanus limicola]|uniref:Methyltransferase type 11 n=1 Tax=Methanoplanus limicola DSM 2279 TaxID=937775 RepID=H1Z0C1_9EURY|nr:polysaccharide pyruvyl transferase family protein [Methanoplanus limicola]EHQ34388.1 Methyltransferase type 11 [Methanoplanus limicola DSM 2279]
MKILILGLTSSGLGGMEYHNLGNYAIMEPLIIELKTKFPEAEISTSIQMSDEFCNNFEISSIHDKRFWTYGPRTGLITSKDLILSSLNYGYKNLKKKNSIFLVKKSKLLSEINSSDLIIDFSGDVYGDNASNLKFLEDNAEIFISKMLGKPVVAFIGSPGPFSSKWRQIIAKKALNSIDLITNRDPISTEILKELGVKEDHMYSTACPAFLFKPLPKEDAEIILKKEGIIPKERPLVGMIICGWNMAEAPFNKLPREEYELIPFVELIKHIISKEDVNVLLMSHQNRTDAENNLIKGNDHAIISQIIELLKRDNIDLNRIIQLDGLYNAAQSKAIIGECDLLISGRIHGAVGGLSQCIPTVIIDYGHEPKAHKLRGFARLAGVEEYICNPASTEDMINKFDKCWINKDKIKVLLEEKIPEVKKKAKENFSLLNRCIFEENSLNNNMSAIKHNQLENVNKLNSNLNHFLKNIQSDTKFIEQIYPLIKKNIDNPDLEILDVGCGSGVLVNKLKKENVSKFVYGCDFSSEKIEKCKKIYQMDSFFVHDIYSLLNNLFDVIICTEVLEHLENPENALKNLLSSLKENGKLIISVPDGRKDTFLGHINFWSPESFKLFITKFANKDKYEIYFYYISNKNICIIKDLNSYQITS